MTSLNSSHSETVTELHLLGVDRGFTAVSFSLMANCAIGHIFGS
jgi:hypothetical protein